MAKVIVVGDGPGGLSAALFLAKSDQDVVVYGQDKTAMHYAELHNYLGIHKVLGSDFQDRAREQVRGFGADLRDEEVIDVAPADGGFRVALAGGLQDRADFVVLAGGKPAAKLAQSLGIEMGPGGVATDRDGRTGVDGVYVVGRLARPENSQAIISAGAGAAAALHILSLQAGKPVTDWDTPPEE